MSETEAVAKAATYLDENHPGWAAKIDTAKLNIADFRSCILAQLHITEYVELNYASFGIADFAPFASRNATSYWLTEIGRV